MDVGAASNRGQLQAQDRNQPTVQDSQQFAAQIKAVASADSSQSPGNAANRQGPGNADNAAPKHRPGGTKDLPILLCGDDLLAAYCEVNTPNISYVREEGEKTKRNKGAEDQSKAGLSPVRRAGPRGAKDDSLLPADQLAALGLMAHQIWQGEGEGQEIQAAPAGNYPGFFSNPVSRLANEIEREAATITNNMNMPNLTALFNVDTNENASFSLGAIEIVPDHALTPEHQLRYIRERLHDIAIWTTTNVGRTALRQGLGSNLRFEIIHTRVFHEDEPSEDESIGIADNGTTVRANFDGHPTPRWQVVTDRQGNPFVPDWDREPNHPTTVRLFHEFLHFLKIDAQGNVNLPPSVYANSRTISLEEAEVVGLGQFENDPLTENRLRAELNLLRRTFYASEAELNQDGSYPLLRNDDGTVVSIYS